MLHPAWLRTQLARHMHGHVQLGLQRLRQGLLSSASRLLQASNCCADSSRHAGDSLEQKHAPLAMQGHARDSNVA